MTSALENLKKRGQIYERFGVKPIINGGGTWTTLGGSIMEPEVLQAMADAGRVMVRLGELNQRAGEMIAKYTGAEAGLVTSGAAAGMMLQAAAVITGKDPAKVRRLPDTEGLRNEIILKWNHSVGYVQNWRQAGARIVWVGDSHGTHAWEIEAAINDKTAALAFVASRWMRDSFASLDEMADIAHRHGLPLIVDAAAMLPPVENLRRFIQHGADMVVFSGGKAIRGPQSTGILAGRKDLIEAAAMNNNPNSSIGRGCKVCKEEIIALMVALERYVHRDHAADQRRWTQYCQTIVDAIAEIPGVTARVEQDDWIRPVPEVAIYLAPDWRGPNPDQVIKALEAGDPPIIIGGARGRGEDLFVNPHGFMEGEAEVVAQRLRAAMLGD